VASSGSPLDQPCQSGDRQSRQLPPRRPADPRAVASGATRSSGPGLRANSSRSPGVVAIRPPPGHRRRRRIATSQNSRWTSNPIDRTKPSSTTGLTSGTPGQTTQTDSRSQRTRASRRGGHRKAGSKPIAQEPACPICVLPEGPCPVATVAPDPDAFEPPVSCPRSFEFGLLFAGALSVGHV
jgi:hypothetical protein